MPKVHHLWISQIVLEHDFPADDPDEAINKHIQRVKGLIMAALDGYTCYLHGDIRRLWIVEKE